MTTRDIIGISILIIAYLITWLLFFRSLKIIKIIDTERIRHINQIRNRLKAGKSTINKKDNY